MSLSKNRRLYLHDFTTLYKQLSTNSYKWSTIGAHLGFLPNELKKIQARPELLLSGAPDSFLREMLSDWLHWTPGDGRGSKSYATLYDLSNALDKSGLGDAACTLLETTFSDPTS